MDIAKLCAVSAPLHVLERRLGEIERRLEAAPPVVAAIRRRFVVGVFAVAAASIFFFQAYDVGLASPKKDWHHLAWVSAHNLAAMAHASPQTGFVGYALHTFEGGRDAYVYFYRSTFIGPLVQRTLTMSFTDDLCAQIFMNRQFMNAMMVLGIWLGFLVLRRLGVSDCLAMASSLLAFSGHYAMFYKDLIAPDSVTAMAMLLGVYGILRFLQTRAAGALYASSIGAVSIGWGYAVLPVIGLHAAYDAVRGWRSAPSRGAKRMGAALRAHGVRVFVITTGLTAALVMYNVAIEMKLRDISWRETDLVGTMLKRTGQLEEFQKAHEDQLEWPRFTKDQLERVARSFPGVTQELPKKNPIATFALAGALVLAFVSAFARWGAAERVASSLLVGSGFLWLFPMRNLAAIHDYTAICYVGVPLAAFGAVARHLPRCVGPIALLFAFCVLFCANLATNEEKNATAAAINGEIREFGAIASALPPGARVYVDKGYRKIVKGSPYALGFLLKDAVLAKELEDAEFVVSKRPDYNRKNLTKKNREVFLFRK
jgi:hypothetical protein